MEAQGGASVFQKVVVEPAYKAVSAAIVRAIVDGALPPGAALPTEQELAERFGVRDYARIYSRSALFATAGIASGPAFIGLLHDAVDGYGIAFAVAAAASVLAAAVLACSGPTRVADPG